VATTFVTGGTGFLGRSVVRELAATGEPILLLARPNSRVSRLPPNVKLVAGDVTDRDSVATAMKGADRILHMAALVSTWRRDPDEFRRVNVDGIKNVLQAAYFAGIERVVYTSTILALGPTDGGIGEEGRPAVKMPGNRYIETKAEALAEVREAVSTGYPVTLLFPGIVYGPGPRREAGIMTRLLADLMAGKLPGLVGPGNKRWSHAYVGDVARAHVVALERGGTGEEFILGGPNETLAAWLELASRVVAVKPPRLRIPYGVAAAVGACEVLLARLTGRTPQLTPDAVRVFAHEWAFSSARAEARLGYVQTPLAEGLRLTAEFLRAGGDA